MSRPMRTLAVLPALAAGVLAVSPLAAPPAAAAREPVEVARQPGVVREVIRGDRWTAWTRCATAQGPTDVWVKRSSSSPPRRVRGLKRGGACSPQRLVGLLRNTLVVELGRPGARRVLAVDVRNGRSRRVVAETPRADGLELVDVDVSGRRIAWIQIVGPPDQREAQVVLGIVGSSATRVVHRRPLVGGAVELAGVWVNPRGEVAYREVLRGALYGYAAREERVQRLDRLGRTSVLANPAAGTQVVAGDLANSRFSYALARDDSRMVWVFTRDLDTGNRRRLRAARAAPPRLARTPPAVPSPRVYGSATVWRERIPVRRSFSDMIRSARGLALARQPIYRRRDVRSQRWFLSPPDVHRRVAVWAEVRLPRAGGWRGGYFGIPRGTGRARSTVLAMPVRAR